MSLARAAVLRRIAQNVLELAALEEADSGDEYSSLDLPPGCPSRRALAERCRRIPAARLEGRVWFVGRAEWHAAARRAKPAIVRRDAKPSNDARVDAVIRGAGFRLEQRSA